MAADRGAFICQSQSLNLFVENANFAKLSSMHFYAWKKGLKTGMYYLRTKAAADAIKFTIDQEVKEVPVEETVNAEGVTVTADGTQTETEKVLVEVHLTPEEQAAQITCSLDNPDECEACGS